MSDDLLVREARDGGVVVLRLNRPPLHPLSMAVLAEIAAQATELAADPALKAVVVTGGEKAFAAGADVAEVTEPGVAPRVSAAFRAAFDALEAIPRPVIAAIEGFALGGGFELALACDLRVAGEGARLGFPEIQLGIFPGAGGTQRTTRLIGPARTKDLVWTGRHVKAPEALELGLVDRVVPAGTALDAAVELATSLGSGAVVAMGLSKRVIDRGLDGSLSDGLDLEAAAFAAVFDTDDASTGVRSFLDDGPGKATFQGR
ncbi:MAG TPA: enoyl-CoA hydratase-related protein [Acidimicrobiia bacterium]|nr:enoyl-CoA hydratase-related protein [Acidimicrobiia bacterium]